MAKVTLEIDTAVSAAYIRLGDTAVVRTVDVADEVAIDLDEFEMVVGIEMLDTEAEIPLNAICERFHVREDVRRLLAEIVPSLRSRIQNPLGGDADSSGATELTFA